MIFLLLRIALFSAFTVCGMSNWRFLLCLFLYVFLPISHLHLSFTSITFIHPSHSLLFTLSHSLTSFHFDGISNHLLDW